ncbi:hypothetical protein THAOC_04134 [Thalassiosira oceanica]|uniref:Uncharacterized protein n=1 Tax=Thalassiosira oceanica TaxID=159749 RepID=K0TAV0_THAOC|nr:hypothetical protein THAOC_04134 [Thalassiosira oceanica]|eukprot:EJK74199.1 hypothetical protein THAOC_04134 [Thalassiosira oceanica]
MSNMNNMKPQTHRHQPDNMTLRNGKDVYPKYDPFEFMILRSGRGVLLYNIGTLGPTNKSKEAIINPPFKLDDGTPRRLVPDEVQSSNRFGHNDLADFTQPNILREAYSYSTVKVAPAQMDGQGSRGEQLGKLRAEREAKAIMPGKLRAEREAKAIMKLAGRDKSQWCNLHVIG